MRAIKAGFAVLAAVVLCTGLAYGQVGNPDYHFVRSEPPVVMEIDLGDVSYDFTGEATIPFTLRNSRAHIWLVIYTKDQATPEGYGGPTSPIAPNGALWRRGGIPNMVTVVDKGQFEEGSHTIAWDGTDWEGNKVAAGNYSLYVIGMNDQDDVNLVGILPIGMRYGMGDAMVDRDGVGWLIGPGRGDAWELPTTRNNTVLMNKIGENDWLENPTNITAIFVPNMVARWSMVVDPDNVFRQWGSSYGDNPDGELLDEEGNKINLGSNMQGVAAWTVSEDLTESWPLEGFGDENSQVRIISDNVNKFMGLHYHDEKIYLVHGWLTNPPQSEVIVMDAQTGEILEDIDVNEWFTTTGVDYETADEVTGSNGPGEIFVDDSGIYIAAMSYGTSAMSNGPNGGADFGLFMKMDFERNPYHQAYQ